MLKQNLTVIRSNEYTVMSTKVRTAAIASCFAADNFACFRQ